MTFNLFEFFFLLIRSGQIVTKKKRPNIFAYQIYLLQKLINSEAKFVAFILDTIFKLIITSIGYVGVHMGSLISLFAFILSYVLKKSSGKNINSI